MTYLITAYPSRAYVRALGAGPQKPLTVGPWKRRKASKRLATALRQARIVTENLLGETLDLGPMYSRVQLEIIGGGY